jgi:hypothetical protein
MDSLEEHRKAAAFLAMVGRLRVASAQRDGVVRPFRERYDRSNEDLRMPREKRLEIAEAFIQAAYRADHVYEECLGGALDEYREMLVAERGSGNGAVARLGSPVAHVHSQLHLR